MTQNQMVKERIDSMVSILDKNKISFNRQFQNATQTAYDKEEYGLYAFKLVDDLEKFVTYGVNHGFKNVKDDIKKITDSIAELSKINKASKFQKIMDDHNKLMGKEVKVLDSDGVIKTPVLNALMNTIDGLENLKKDKHYEEKVEVIESLEAGLKEDMERVAKLFDNYSVIAYEYAFKALQTIMDLRDKVAKGSMTTLKAKSYLKSLDDILVLWENQKSSQLKKAKIGDDFKFDESVVDKFYIAANSQMFFEDFDLLKEETDRFYKTMVDDSKINQLIEQQNIENEKLDNIKNQAQELKKQYEAKKITKDEAAVRLKQLQLQMAIANDKVASFAKQLEKLGSSRYAISKKIYDIVSEICMIVDQNQDNKEFIYVLSKHFDIDSALSLINGNPSAEDILKVKESFQAARIYASEQAQIIKEGLESIKLVSEMLDEEEQDIQEGFVLNKPKETTEEDLDNLFSSFGVEKTKEDKEDEDNSQTINVNDLL